MYQPFTEYSVDSQDLTKATGTNTLTPASRQQW
jgi:hypothetical protein